MQNHNSKGDREGLLESYHKLKPVIDRVFTFDKAKEAFSYMESGGYVGKIVIRLRAKDEPLMDRIKPSKGGTALLLAIMMILPAIFLQCTRFQAI